MTTRKDPGPAKKILSPGFWIGIFVGALSCPLTFAFIDQCWDVAATLIWVEAGMIVLWLAMACGWPKPFPATPTHIVACPNCKAELAIRSGPNGLVVTERGP